MRHLFYVARYGLNVPFHMVINWCPSAKLLSFNDGKTFEKLSLNHFYKAIIVHERMNYLNGLSLLLNKVYAIYML